MLTNGLGLEGCNTRDTGDMHQLLDFLELSFGKSFISKYETINVSVMKLKFYRVGVYGSLAVLSILNQ